MQKPLSSSKTLLDSSVNSLQDSLADSLQESLFNPSITPPIQMPKEAHLKAAQNDPVAGDSASNSAEHVAVSSLGSVLGIVPQEGRSHVAGIKTPPLRRVTVPQMLAETARLYGRHDAAIFVQQGVRYSYSDFVRAVDGIAEGFLSLGLQPGDRVGIWSPNRLEWLLTQFATARIGLVLVTINPAYRIAELEYVLNKVSCRALVSACAHKTSNYLGMIETLAPELKNSLPGQLRSAKLPHLRMVIHMGDEERDGMIRFAMLPEYGGPAQRARLDGITAGLDPDDPINIQFTSGTTGAPKGATLTHMNIVNNAVFTALTMNLTKADRLCIPVPLYHCFGMVLGTLACVTVGAAMIFPGEAFEAEATLAAVSVEKCTALYGVPTMFVAMLDHAAFGQYKLNSLRTGMMAGAPCPIEVMQRVIDDMNMGQVTIGYGMTETSPISFQSHVNEELADRVGTVGRIHPHVEVKIIDEDGQIVPVGVQGALCTRGYSVMQGYWDDETQTRDSIDAQGWMHSGDLATLDERGYCRIVGRVKDMVIRGGENLYPREIEEFLYRHPQIADVQIFGVPDTKYGEELCAWIIPQSGAALTADSVRAFCQDQIAHHKIPHYIRFVDAMPLTATGKPQKFKMREAMIVELGLV